MSPWFHTVGVSQVLVIIDLSSHRFIIEYTTTLFSCCFHIDQQYFPCTAKVIIPSYQKLSVGDIDALVVL